VLGNFTALVAVNNTPVVASAEHVHAASSWPCDSLPVSLDSNLILQRPDNLNLHIVTLLITD